MVCCQCVRLLIDTYNSLEFASCRILWRADISISEKRISLRNRLIGLLICVVARAMDSNILASNILDYMSEAHMEVYALSALSMDISWDPCGFYPDPRWENESYLGSMWTHWHDVRRERFYKVQNQTSHGELVVCKHG